MICSYCIGWWCFVCNSCFIETYGMWCRVGMTITRAGIALQMPAECLLEVWEISQNSHGDTCHCHGQQTYLSLRMAETGFDQTIKWAFQDACHDRSKPTYQIDLYEFYAVLYESLWIIIQTTYGGFITSWCFSIWVSVESLYMLYNISSRHIDYTYGLIVSQA